MRLAVLADVHGNLPALEAVLADVRQWEVDGTIVAGDFGHGPQEIEVIDVLRSLDGWMIRGNAEDYFLACDAGEAPEAWHEGKQWATMRWSYRRYGRETLDFIASLPEQRVVTLPGVAPIRVVHGSPRSVSEPLFPDRDPARLRLFREAGLLRSGCNPTPLEPVLSQIDEPVLVCGHTHIPWKQEGEGRLAFNPGSVGSSIDGDVRAQYALLNWQDGRWQVEHRAVPYDLDRVRAAFHASGLLDEGGAFARAYLASIETGQNVVLLLLAHVYRFAAEAGCEDPDAVPDAIWDQAVATFGW